MSWKSKFSYALQHYLRDIHGVQTKSDQEMFQKIRSLGNQQRRGIWAVISEILDILPQDAHDYYHNTWTKQFFDPIDSIKDQIEVIIQQKSEIAESKKDLVQISLKAIKQQFPNKNFHPMTIKQFLYHMVNKTDKFNGKYRAKIIVTQEELYQQHIMNLVSIYLKGLQ